MHLDPDEPQDARRGVVDAAPAAPAAPAAMEVYLVPLGPDRHELYCEVADEPPEPETIDGTVRAGWFSGLRRRFRAMIAVAEAERRGDATGSSDAGTRGWSQRVRDRVIGAVAEAIAEQRLLWNLRRQTVAVLVHPNDLSEAQALVVLRTSLRRDAEKHRLWLVVDLVAFVASGLLALIPGPNLIAYYFAFRLVGHYFSLRGARQGLDRVQWQTRASGPLAELRAAVSLASAGRASRLRELCEQLDLRHLAAFVERVALRSA